MTKEFSIISITDIIEQKLRKEQIHEFIIRAVRNEITPQAFIQGLIKAELKKDE